ncbi:NUDIX domain-containing protein [Vibrio parahaemolyticus]|uniref:NUDIX domain-containing protein n=1 Tax=Vibrio parahaemolyticus TaxID=670 RepID=UPI00111CF80A|nr:NUDIX domain-containing protein [Vibrio parahaemolyticus]MDA0390508.1 NUDIX domain-containing protein [Vibrio parahaemolyticus]MDA0395066.1 NUDIX domain-containing protein [Vibrio parahaemolyticus]MDA0399608.1 NUDIX domain-containing protein [Vibrio parahaemolyticus]MDA0404273.1 NUDIX domain-containing protein [Vibrio parahaemolyticus]TOK03617.1 DNA mismatch repair protein MutT [Vibrio parahaemolyticus]
MQYGIKHHIEVTAKAAGAVIFNQYGEVLLVQELTGSKKGLWHIPSGSVEFTEFPQEAALREIAEETGLEVALETYLNTYVGRFDDGDLVLRHVWVTEVANQVILPKFNHEIGRAKFFSLAEVQELYAQSKLRMHHTFLMINDAYAQREKLA